MLGPSRGVSESQFRTSETPALSLSGGKRDGLGRVSGPLGAGSSPRGVGLSSAPGTEAATTQQRRHRALRSPRQHRSGRLRSPPGPPASPAAPPHPHPHPRAGRRAPAAARAPKAGGVGAYLQALGEGAEEHQVRQAPQPPHGGRPAGARARLGSATAPRAGPQRPRSRRPPRPREGARPRRREGAPRGRAGRDWKPRRGCREGARAHARARERGRERTKREGGLGVLRGGERRGPAALLGGWRRPRPRPRRPRAPPARPQPRREEAGRRARAPTRGRRGLSLAAGRGPRVGVGRGGKPGAGAGAGRGPEGRSASAIRAGAAEDAVASSACFLPLFKGIW